MYVSATIDIHREFAEVRPYGYLAPLPGGGGGELSVVLFGR